MKELIGRTATNKNAKLILQGRLNVEEINTTEATKAVLRYLGEDQKADIPQHFTMKEIMNGFRRWREETATSPSGRHLGTYKAAFSYTKQVQEIQDPTSQEMTIAEKIMYAITATINTTVHHQVILQIWMKVICCMIVKSP